MASSNGHQPLSLKVLGTNQGTSMDGMLPESPESPMSITYLYPLLLNVGIDIVHVHFTQASPSSRLHLRLLHYGEISFPPRLKQKAMRAIKEGRTSPEEVSVLNIRIGEFVASALRDFAAQHSISLKDDVDLIGGQGMTLWHCKYRSRPSCATKTSLLTKAVPLPDLFPGRDVSRAHMDIGEISVIAANTGVTTMGNFRVSDMALGRQGCPIFSALDSLLVNHPTKNRAVQNIGGIANFSISPAGDVQGHYDFDTGPGNVFIDAAVRFFTDGKQEYDKDGAMGAKGTVDQRVVDEVLSNSYFGHDIPKTTGRETFGDELAEDICKQMIANSASPEDCVATITRVTAQSLLDHYERYAPKPLHEVFMGGGGSYNPNIINYLREKMPQTKFALIDELGIPAGAKEALGFSLYTCEGFVGRPLMVPRRVESRRPGVIGHIQPGDNHFDLRRKVVEFWGSCRAVEVKATTEMVYERD